jgi:cell division septal protein FtsQ
MSSQPYRASRQPSQGGRREPLTTTSKASSRLGLLVTKMIAIVLLFGASGLLYHVAASDDFLVSKVVVTGAQLVSAGEIQEAAAINGLNIFWVRQEEVGHRLQAISAIQSARVTIVLPNRLDVRIVERAPVAVWQNGGSSFLVDADGRVLLAIDQPVSLPTIRDVGSQPVQTGGTVDALALVTTFRLQQLLPAVATLRPTEFEYSPDTGVTVVADTGARVRFGLDDDLDWKVAALVAVRRDLERRGQRAELIDLRFKDRPYVR